MELNNIKSIGIWGEAANDLNQNFNKINSEVEKVKNVTTRNKGYFSSSDALNAAFSTANVGDIAYVGESYPYQTWAWDGTEWKKKNDVGGEESVNLGNYYTKEETDGKFTEADAKLSELGSKIGLANLSLEFKTKPREYLYGDFRKGDVISVDVSDFTTIGETGQANVAVLDNTNAYLKVFTMNGTAQITLPRDTTYLHIALGVEGYTGFTANVLVKYKVLL